MQTGSLSNIVLCTSGLKKCFGDLTAVDNLDLEIYQGEIFGLLGPNGAGKSTSINMICGLIRPDAGQILINNVQTDPARKSRKKFGLCPQEVIIWPKLTCLEQLVFIGEMYGMQTGSAVKSGLDLLLRLGLDEKTNKLAGTLSGGMKRRLNICLALVHDPEIVVLDEPEAGLDPQSKIMVRDFIRSLRKNKTVVLTTHNMDEADRLSDRVAIIDNGKLLVTDTPENLKKTVGIGDVLEIVIKNDGGKDLNKAVELLQTISGKIAVAGDCILLREKNAIELIPAITAKLQEGSFVCTEIKMRANTLEDVFIQLTGKKLRE
jgi:ABC-2 type transport system ATP-binding protein